MNLLYWPIALGALIMLYGVWIYLKEKKWISGSAPTTGTLFKIDTEVEEFDKDEIDDVTGEPMKPMTHYYKVYKYKVGEEEYTVSQKSKTDFEPTLDKTEQVNIRYKITYPSSAKIDKSKALYAKTITIMTLGAIFLVAGLLVMLMS